MPSDGNPMEAGTSIGTRSTGSILLISVVALLVYYYLARTDIIGVSSRTGSWSHMTVGLLPVYVHTIACALLLAVLPVAVARSTTGLSLARLGLGKGNLSEGARWLLAGIPLAVLAGFVASGSPALVAVYPLDAAAATENYLLYASLQFLYFGAWEVLFRGVLLFGLRAHVGDGTANVIQTALSVLAHFGRALGETASALPAGLIFGWVAMRTGSVWYVALIHWTVGVSMDWFILRSLSP